MCVLAHPDDESLEREMLAKYSREGVKTYVVTATRGERGRFDERAPRQGLKSSAGPGKPSCTRRRTSSAARSDPARLSRRRAGSGRRDRSERQDRPPHSPSPAACRRQFDPFGAYGHPTRSQSPVHRRGDCARGRRPSGLEVLLFRQWRAEMGGVQAAFKTLTSKVDGPSARPSRGPTGRSRRRSTRATCGGTCGAPPSATRRR